MTVKTDLEKWITETKDVKTMVLAVCAVLFILLGASKVFMILIPGVSQEYIDHSTLALTVDFIVLFILSLVFKGRKLTWKACKIIFCCLVLIYFSILGLIIKWKPDFLYLVIIFTSIVPFAFSIWEVKNQIFTFKIKNGYVYFGFSILIIVLIMIQQVHLFLTASVKEKEQIKESISAANDAIQLMSMGFFIIAYITTKLKYKQ
ncbi:hypothetical protein BWGOE13_55240 [Bacillus mycoides]|uniref:Uncharacterized protein n=1 Tax=Bacillus mycoides TaxID=1405 RepID=A0A1E8BLG6_BACMY|nr:hypothetical protein [Bacillus mycoides]OFD90557.1 hypothetical protein BWGOE11_34210 [Bacillus mycoides]OFD91324.1 hypothetical protein BWGOE13_55240 [Bacillus mycoides]